MLPQDAEELLQPISQKPGDDKYHQGIEQRKQEVSCRTAGDKGIFARIFQPQRPDLVDDWEMQQEHRVGDSADSADDLMQLSFRFRKEEDR